MSKMSKGKRETLYKDKMVNTHGYIKSVNTYVYNIGVPKYINQTLTDLKGTMDTKMK